MIAKRSEKSFHFEANQREIQKCASQNHEKLHEDNFSMHQAENKKKRKKNCGAEGVPHIFKES